MFSRCYFTSVGNPHKRADGCSERSTANLGARWTLQSTIFTTGRDEEAPYVGKSLMSSARLHPPDDPFNDTREIARGEPRRRSQQLPNRDAREKTPPCALDGGPPCECLLRLARHGVPIHRELVHRIHDSFELARVHESFRFQEIRKLARVRFEISLPGLPFLDELETSCICANSDACARNHRLGSVRGAAVVPFRVEDRGRAEAP